VAQDKDVVVLATFSRPMAWREFGPVDAIARPDLLAKSVDSKHGMLPSPAWLRRGEPRLRLVSERRAINKKVREDTFAFLEKKKIDFIRSERTFHDDRQRNERTASERAIGKHKVYIGRTGDLAGTSACLVGL